MKKVAIPIVNNVLSDFFGQCHHYEIFDLEGEKIAKQKKEFPLVKTLSELPAWISAMGITDVVTYKIDKSIIHLFAKYKINLYVGIAKKNSKEIINDYISGKLNSNNNIISEIITNDN